MNYSIPYSFISSENVNGIGDIMINYRYQLLYKDDAFCLSPRLSVVLPTDKKDKGLVTGILGFQMALPASKRLSEKLAIHINLGATYLNEAEAVGNDGKKISKGHMSNFEGASLMWLLNQNFNIFAEYLTYFNSTLNTEGKVKYSTQTLVNPGLRFAINLNKLQIVPGISMPVYIKKSEKPVKSVIFYLSFEHPY